MTSAPPAYHEMDGARYRDEVNLNPSTSADTMTPLVALPLPAKEAIEEFSLPQPSPRARRNRTTLFGWMISAILAVVLILSYLPSVDYMVLFRQLSTSATNDPPGQTAFDNLFVFGDSYSTTLFDVQGTQPNEQNPLGNSNYTKPVWVNFLTSLYNTTVLRTYDLAVGGSTVDRSIVNPQYTTATSFKQQVQDVFVPNYGKGNREPTESFTSDNSLFAVWFGINDIVISAGQMQYTPLERMFNSYKASLEELYANGARNFLLINVPPIDNVYRAYDTTTMRSDIESFNARLLSLRMHFQRAHPEISMWLFDVHELYHQVIRNPTAYEQTAQLRNVTDVCGDYLMDNTAGDVYAADCKFPLSQYFWQNLHTTPAVHNLTAALIAQDCLGPKETSPSGYCS